jgi:hypothetical protein
MRNPKDEKSAKEKRVKKQYDVKFINYSLSAAQKSELKSLTWTLEDHDTALIRLNEGGYNVSHKYDDYGECFSCFVSPAPGNLANEGYILTGRGSTPVKAFKQACYLHWQIFDQDWSEHYTSREKEGFDD